MYKLWATIRKDARILGRDKLGLLFMFGMPIVLVIIVTAIQNSAFESAGSARIPLLVCNRDTGTLSGPLVDAIERSGMFRVIPVPATQTDAQVAARVHKKDALAALVIPGGFTVKLESGAKGLAGKALHSFGLQDSTAVNPLVEHAGPIAIYEHPVLQESFRRAVRGTVGGAIQLLESRLVLQEVYRSVNGTALPDSIQSSLLNVPMDLREIPLVGKGPVEMPNAAQHNVPAWTIFAMFFVVISLGSSIVREKTSGSFLRLKTLPTSYKVAILSKQVTYIVVTIAQTALIFAIGVTLFPVLGLPVLHMPADWAGLVLVTFLCGWCAVSYAICVGVYARTPEQANGFGAVSIVILAVIGGLMVPAFVMPEGLRVVMNLSPLHWCLEAYYALFLEGGRLQDVWVNILPLTAITLLLQGVAWWGLRQRHLI